MTTMTTAPADPTPTVPWWRVGTALFGVVALGVVVIASFMLLATAIRHRDSVLDEEVPAHASAAPNQSDSPALKARNHAATPR